MDPRRAHFIDQYVGNFIILFLIPLQSLVGFFLGSRSVPNDPQRIRSILIIKYFGLGTIINTTPMIQQLRNKYPQAEITFTTFTSNKEFFEITGLVDHVIPVRFDSPLAFVWDSIKAVWKIRRRNIQISFDLEYFSNYTMLISLLSGAPIRVGFFSSIRLRSALITHPSMFNHYRHISRNFLNMLKIVNTDAEDKDKQNDIHITLPSQLDVYKKELDRLIGLTDDKYIITVNPNASSLSFNRRWPIQNYVKLIQSLASRHPKCRFVLIGTPSEKEYISTICDKCKLSPKVVVNAAGRTNLGILMALLECSSLLISNDSGPVHLAAGYKTNTVALFGPETPVLYGPLNSNAIVIYRDLFCSPCLSALDNKINICQENKCMDRIGVDEVLCIIEDKFLPVPKVKTIL